jgi:hypothetical protein
MNIIMITKGNACQANGQVLKTSSLSNILKQKSFMDLEH